MLVGACGKSAQIPLYVWLPDAMEGPTPVSALIHAATMVTAGVYMVCRSNSIFSRAPIALLAVAIIGTLTSFFAATIGITQTDIKRVLAYSTVSQLGYMFMAAGVAAYSAAVFHLMTHAFFKALLFLGAGSVIHGVGGEQDMRKMGGLRKYMPWTFWTMLIATLAIAGIPPFAGFFSKDEILWQAFSSPHGSKIFWVIGVITAFMTSFYMFRLRLPDLLRRVSRRASRDAHSGSTAAHDDHGHDDHHGSPHESPWLMLAPLVLLAVLSIVGGWVGIGNRFEHFLDPVILKVSAEQNARPYRRSRSHAGQRRRRRSRREQGTGKSPDGRLRSRRPRRSRPRLVPLRQEPRAARQDRRRLRRPLQARPQQVLDRRTLWRGHHRPAASRISRAVLWQTVDQKVIDGTVNESAVAARDVSQVVRQQQSGLIRSYAGWVAAGAAAVVAYMVWMGTR